MLAHASGDKPGSAPSSTVLAPQTAPQVQHFPPAPLRLPADSPCVRAKILKYTLKCDDHTETKTGDRRATAGCLADVAVIGFANKPGKAGFLARAGADTVTTALAEISTGGACCAMCPATPERRLQAVGEVFQCG